MHTETRIESPIESAWPIDERACILLVDDRPESLLSLEASLESEQYKLVKAGSGPEALEQLLKQDFAVVVLDIQMPGMDGFEVARLVRGRERSGHTPIIFLTAAYQNQDYVFRAYEAGAVDYIVKPVVPEILRSKVAAFVALHRLRSQLERQLAETRRLNQELETSNRALARSESRLQEMNATLEQRVLQRTDEMRRAEEKYRSIFEHVGEGIVQVTPQGRVLTANPALAQILGFASSEELINSAAGFFEFIPDLAERDRLKRNLAEMDQVERLELRIRRQDGDTRWVTINAHSVYEAPARVAYYEGTVQDITERRQNEAALRFLIKAGASLASSLDYQETLDTVTALAVPQLADWCAVELLGEDGSLTRLATRSACPGSVELPGEGDETVQRALRTGEPQFYPAGARPSGSSSGPDASGLIVPLIARGRILGALELFACTPGRHYGQVDLPLFREFAGRAALAVDNGRLYQESQAALRTRDHFLAVASHELKTPLTVISGYVELLKRQVQSTRRAAQKAGDSGENVTLESAMLLRQINNLEGAAARLAHLVDDLLDINRMQTRSLELVVERFDLTSLFAEVIDNFVTREQARHPGVDIRASCEAPEIWGWWDRGRLEQVMANLVDNAIKYSPKRGAVEVRLALEPGEKAEPQAHLVVRDYGIGIPPDELKKLFRPFTRAANASVGHFPGLGLGLAISRQIVQGHGGSIWVESAGTNQGSTFHVVIPVRDTTMGDSVSGKE